MKYHQLITLKNGKELLIRNADRNDGKDAYEIFKKCHEETDYLLSYSDENKYDIVQEGEHLQERTDSEDGIEVIAILDGVPVATAGIEPIGKKYKVKHRAQFGIGVLKDYWGLGIGRALLNACIECAKAAGYEQLELDVVKDNERAISLYKNLGFVEFGRNPKGFKSKISGYQELVYMYLDLQKH